MQGIDSRNRYTLEADNDVADLEPGLGSGAIGLDRGDTHARLGAKAVEAQYPARQGNSLSRNPDEAPPHPAMADQLRHHELGSVAGDGERDTLRATNDRSVDADDRTSRRYQQHARIARVERRVGLRAGVDQPTRATAHRPTVDGWQGPAHRAVTARRHGALDTERIANRYGELAGTNGARITEFGVAEAVGMELKHGEIGIGIIANRIGEEGAAVDQSC